MLGCVRRSGWEDARRRGEAQVERADEAEESWDGQEARDGGLSLSAALSKDTGVG